MDPNKNNLKLENDFPTGQDNFGYVLFHAEEDLLKYNEKSKKILNISESKVKITDLVDFLDIETWSPIQDISLVKNEIIIQVKENNKLFLAFLNTIAEDQYHLTIFENSKFIDKILRLQLRENHLKNILSSMNESIIEVTIEGEILHYWGNKFTQDIDKTNLKVGKNINDIFNSTVSSSINELIIDCVFNQETKKIEFSETEENIQNRWYEIIIKPLSNPEKTVLLITSDITAIHDVQEKIKFSEQKFYQAFHFSGVGTTLTNLQGNLIEGNTTLIKILGYSHQELKQIKSIDITHPDDQERDTWIRNQLLEGKKDCETFSKRYLHKDGYYIWCSITLSLVRNQYNMPLFFIVQLIDITDSKRSKEILKIQKKQLEATMLDLESKIVQLEESHHIIAHNIQSPVSNISMIIDYLNKEDDIKEQKKYWRLLQKSFEELQDTLHDLTSILSQQHQNIPYENCNFEEIYQHLISLKRKDIENKKAIIKTNFEVESIYFPKIYIESIFEELLDNAIQYSSPLRIPTIHIRTFEEDDFTVFSIQDNGLGMDLEKIKPQLFMFKKIFHRGFNNKGIGLFLSKFQIELLGGKIDVESVVNKGTTFLVKFPKESKDE